MTVAPVHFAKLESRDLKKAFLFPLLVFLAYFAAEKIFLLPTIKRLTQSDPTFLYFEYKSQLLQDMEKMNHAIQLERQKNHFAPEYRGKKTILIMGSSRLLYFDYKNFQKSYPDWEMFNFSAPVTTPAYYAYVLERVLERGIVPDYIVMESDPFQFNDGSDAFVKSNLGYSFDIRFLFSHMELFKKSEISYFLARNLFAAYRYPPEFSNMIRRIKNPGDPRLMTFDLVDRYQRENRGCGKSILPKEDWYERDFSRLETGSQKTIRWLYGNYILSDRQFQFLQLALSEARAKKIPVLLVRPPVSRPMQRMLDNDGRINQAVVEWHERVKKLETSFHTDLLDLTKSNPDFFCNTFMDGSHMSLDCYEPFLTAIMGSFPRVESLAAH